MNKFLSLLLAIFLAAFSTNSAAAARIDDLGKVLFVGDSYCMGANIDNDGSEHVDESWAVLAATQLNMTNYSLACAGGTGFFHKNEGGQDYLSLVQNYVNNNTDMDSVRQIVIFAGYNDQWHSYDEIMIRGEETLKYIIEKFPNANISIGMVGWHNSNEQYQLQLANVSSQAYRDLTSYMGLNYIEGAETILVNGENLFSNDDFHPSRNGQDRMASFIASFLNAELEKQHATEETLEPMFKDVDKKFPLYLVAIAVIIIVIIAVIRIRFAH